MISKKRVGIGAGIGILALIFAIIYVPPYQNGAVTIPTPVGEDIPDNTTPTNDETTEDSTPFVVTTIAPSESQGEDTSDDVTIIDTTPIQVTIPSGGTSGVTSSSSHRHHSSSGSSNNNEDNSSNDNDNNNNDVTGDAVIRVTPNTIPPGGIDVTSFGITDIAATTHVSFELCLLDSENPCTTQTDNAELSPISFTPTPDGLTCDTTGCEEYSTTFADELLSTPGTYRIEATFFDSENNELAVRGQNLTVPPILVIPESPIGLIALFGTSLGTLGAYVCYQRTHRK